ncbi:MAG: hypothetical protein AAGK04_14220, partial [Planctomycetota bacterium]
DSVGLEVGVGVRRASGRIGFAAGKPGEDEPMAFDLRFTGERAWLAGVEATGLSVRATSGAKAGSVIVPLISADCHGGRLSGDARVFPIEDDGNGLRYDANVQLAGVGLADTLADLRAAGEGATVPSEDTSGVFRGVLDGRIGLAGRTGERAEKRGRGTLQASGGRVLDLPLALRLIEVSNLALPTGETLDFGRANFIMENDRVTFEDVSAFSRSVEVLGHGEMDWPTRAIDLRFNSRAARRIPLVSDVLEALRDELISTEVVGTIDAPEIRVTQFSGTQRAIDRLLGQQTQQDRRMAELARRAREQRAEEARVRPVRRTADAGVNGSP